MVEKLRSDWPSADQKINPNNFTEEHKAHVLDLVDDDPQVTVCDVLESLTTSFEDF
ncbi:hypothetical protein BD408DRAFT_423476 [Parasitella parasitica]|nr:hypothetical protein BD408DRAFT_423476 [Parasitella parasitica]